MHTHGCWEAGLGNSRGRQKIPRDTTGGTCMGGPALVPWHERAWEAAVAMDTAPTPPPASLSSLQPELRVGISLGASPERQEMSPTLSLPGRSLLGLPDLCRYQGLLAQLLRRTGRPGRAAQGSRRVGGWLLHNPIRPRQGGRVERPLAAPQALMPRQGNHSLKCLGF